MSDRELVRPDWANDSSRREYAFLLFAADESRRALEFVQSLPVTSSLKLSRTDYDSREIRFQATGAEAFRLFSEARHQANNLNANLNANLDIFVLPQSMRKIRLLICDMDSTIIPTESLDELAHFVDLADEVAEITERAMRGELDFEAALKQRVGMLKGLAQERIDECVSQTQFNPGAGEMVRAANEAGIRTVLVSGGFSPFVSFVANCLGFSRWEGNQLEIVNQQLSGKVLPPIVDKSTKLTVLNEECELLGCTPDQVCSLGDGANDIPMLQGSGLGIAYRAKPQVLQATPYHLQFADFTAVTKLLNLNELPA